jgi:hypothetical protein
MSQHSVGQAARRSALDAQAARRKERADRERRLEALAVAVLTALAERDALVRDAERRAGQALRTTLIKAVDTNESDELIGHSALEFGRAGALAAFTVCDGRAAAI